MPTILLVEDDFGIREALAAMLDAEGYRVVSTADGREALGYLQARLDSRQPLPSLIVTDLNMPHMNGRLLINELRRHRKLSSVPIIAVSATAIHELAALPVAATFVKPIRDADAFLDAIVQYGEWCALDEDATTRPT
jgi:CheY-like chemotaxis protein